MPDARARIKATINSDVHLFIDPMRAEQVQLTADAQERVNTVLAGGLEGVVTRYYGEKAGVRDAALRLLRAKPSELSLQIGAIFKEQAAGTASTGALT